MRVANRVLFTVAVAAICTAKEPEKYHTWGDAGVIYPPSQLVEHGLWVTGDVINDPKEGLMFRVDRPVQDNTTGTLVSLTVPEDLSKTFGPMCYQAAERHMKLRLHGTFLPHSLPTDPKHPSVNFVVWGLHLPDEPDELPPDKKTYFGPHDAIPGYTIIPKKP